MKLKKNPPENRRLESPEKWNDKGYCFLKETQGQFQEQGKETMTKG